MIWPGDSDVFSDKNILDERTALFAAVDPQSGTEAEKNVGLWGLRLAMATGVRVCRPLSGYGSKLTHQGTAGVSLLFCLTEAPFWGCPTFDNHSQVPATAKIVCKIRLARREAQHN